MNLTGREAMMTWSIQHGSFDGVKLDGLSVIAVVKAENTLGDINRFPEPSNSVLIVDELADAQQREALIHFAQSKAGSVLGKTTNVQSAPDRCRCLPELHQRRLLQSSRRRSG